MINQRAIVISGPDLDGLWDRGVSGEPVTNSLQNTCPPLGFTEAQNIRFFPWGFKTRQGYSTYSLGITTSQIRQIIAYSTNNAATGAVIKGEIVYALGPLSDPALFDTASPTPNTELLDTGGIFTDYYFSIIVIFGKLYFTKHTLNTGSNGDAIYIYSPGTGVAPRFAAGIAPQLGAFNAVSSGTAGLVTQGTHVFGVAYETDSGHIMGISSDVTPGLRVNAYNLANANQQVTVTGIPLGPVGTVKRFILGSVVITGYSGNPTDYALFFIPGAEIDDNTTTTLTFNFTDESLVDSADYLFDLLQIIHAGLGFCWYNNRLIIYGIISSDTGLTTKSFNPNTLIVSNEGKPESFDTTSGIIDVFVDDGEYGVKNVFEQDGLLVICKTNKTYVTRDNGGDPNTWDVDSVDYTLGSSVFGVSKSLDTTGASKSGKTIVATKPGLYSFQGQYLERPLSWKIARRWQEISEDPSFIACQVMDVPQAKTLFVSVSNLNSGNLTTYWLVGEYSLGLTWDKIRWSEWHPNDSVNFMTLRDNTTIHFTANGSVPLAMTMGTSDLDYGFIADFVTRIPAQITTAELKFDTLLNKYQLVQVRVRGHSLTEGEGQNIFKVLMEVGEDSFGVTGAPTPSLVPVGLASPEIIKGIINFSGYYPRVRFTWSGQLFEVRQIIVSGNVTAEDQLTQ